MSFDASDPHRWSRALSKALRAVRKASGLRTIEVAERMNMHHRTYEHFEGGGGKVNVERIYTFASATQSDPFGVIGEVITQSPGLAARTAKNKLATSLAISLHDFNAEAGDDIELLETSQLLTAFSDMFATLTADARRRRKAIEDLKRRTDGWGQPPGEDNSTPTDEDPGSENGSEDEAEPDPEPDEE